jgi:hypothetical protein
MIVEDDIPLQLRSTHIVCIGAPSSGLLNATQTAWACSATSDEVFDVSVPHPCILSSKIYVADIGINDAWLLYGESLGLKPGPVVEFGLEWYTRVYALNQPDLLDGNEDTTEKVEGNDYDDK